MCFEYSFVYDFVNWLRNLVSIVFVGRLCACSFLLSACIACIHFFHLQLLLRLICYLKFCLVLIIFVFSFRFPFFNSFSDVAEHICQMSHFLSVVVAVIAVVVVYSFKFSLSLVLNCFRAIFHFPHVCGCGKCAQRRKRFVIFRLYFSSFCRILPFLFLSGKYFSI